MSAPPGVVQTSAAIILLGLSSVLNACGVPHEHYYSEPTPTIVPSPTPGPYTSPPNPVPPAYPIVHFRALIEEYQYEIFKAAHPTGNLDRNSSTAQITQDDGQTGVVVDNISWRGRVSGKFYQTTLQFILTYNNNHIETAKMTVEEMNHPFLSSFSVAEYSKEAALLYLSDKMKAKHGGASIVGRIINSATSVESAVPALLKYAANRG
jgi:hypothetical protein